MSILHLQQQRRLLVICFYYFLVMLTGLASCLQFNQVGFNDYTSNNLSVISINNSPDKNARVEGSTLWLLRPPNPDWNLTIPGTMEQWSSRIEYKDSIAFVVNSANSHAVSFNTSITFQLFTNGIGKSCPSGLAFFISANSQSPPNAQNRYFGLSNDTYAPAFAIEFDTYKTPTILQGEPSDSHIGIDYGSFSSDPVEDTSYNSSYPKLSLYNNYTFTAWISYNASSMITQVWVTTDPANYSLYLDPPPSDSSLTPFLSRTLDLTSFLRSSQDGKMYVGISAGTENSYPCMLSAALYSWYFSIESINIVDPIKSNESSNANQTTKNTPIDANTSRTPPFVIPTLVTLAFVIIIVGALTFLYIIRRRRILNCHSFNVNVPGVINTINTISRYSYKELKTSTDSFNIHKTLIGEGGFSTIFKGTLKDGSTLAVKRLKEGFRKEAEFASEIKVISNIKHRNLLQLEGWSYVNGEALLVYKYMKNGSLERYLSGPKKEMLDGYTRLKILSGVATALEYLHFGLKECILHRDVKAANVLLTYDFEAVLGDFGLARFIKHNQSVTATMVGTPGYVAPEVVNMGKVTDKADVYSFGVLALEVSCGRPVILKTSNKSVDINTLDGKDSCSIVQQHDFVYLVEHVFQLKGNDNLMDALDPLIIQEFSTKELDLHIVSTVHDQWKALLELSLMCCQPIAESRPNMKYVNEVINHIIQQYSDVIGDTKIDNLLLGPTDPLTPILSQHYISSTSYIDHSSKASSSSIR